MAELGKKYCVYCLAEVSSLRFRCTECADIELCPDCFSAGAEIGPHRRWHGYQLVDGGRFTLWGAEAEGGWSSREEQLLLDAIEQFGFGNWVRAAGAGGCRCEGSASPRTVGALPSGRWRAALLRRTLSAAEGGCRDPAPGGGRGALEAVGRTDRPEGRQQPGAQAARGDVRGADGRPECHGLSCSAPAPRYRCLQAGGCRGSMRRANLRAVCVLPAG